MLRGRCECQNLIVGRVVAIVAVRCWLFIVRCSFSCSFVVAGCELWRGLWLVGFYIRRIWYVNGESSQGSQKHQPTICRLIIWHFQLQFGSYLRLSACQPNLSLGWVDYLKSQPYLSLG